MKVERLTANDGAEKILKARAEQLAKKDHAQEPRRHHITVVEFAIAHETYAIELTHIRTIHPLKDLTYIPGAPGFIKGIFNLRGEIISVVDLKHFFDLPDQKTGDSSQVIILSSESMEFGILSDAILGVTEIDTDDIEDSLPTFTGIRLDYLKGVTGKGTVILDDEKLLSDKKMIISL
ncbi:MAG: chemotaxis protein CheW [Desulfosalsimonadaceae bacterium]